MSEPRPTHGPAPLRELLDILLDCARRRLPLASMDPATGKSWTATRALPTKNGKP